MATTSCAPRVAHQAKKVRRDPAYGRFRDSGTVNGATSTTARLIRDGFGFITKHCKDGSFWERLSKAVREQMKTSYHGQSKDELFDTVNLTALEGIQWNALSHMDSVFQADHATFINPALGDTDIIIASFNPAEALRPPEDATHFSIVMAAVSFQQGSKQRSTQFKRMEMMPCSSPMVPTVHIRFPAAQNSPSLVISGLGIIFYGQVRTKFKTLPESAFAISKVCRPALLQAS